MVELVPLVIPWRYSPQNSLFVVAACLYISVGMTCLSGSGLPAARHRNVTIWPRVKMCFVPKVVLSSPVVILFATAH